jgi:hypothetical protein
MTSGVRQIHRGDDLLQESLYLVEAGTTLDKPTGERVPLVPSADQAEYRWELQIIETVLTEPRLEFTLCHQYQPDLGVGSRPNLSKGAGQRTGFARS